jgi:hypothetical protein
MKRKKGHYHAVPKQTIREAKISANPNLELKSQCSFVTVNLDRNSALITNKNCNILTCCKYTGPTQVITNILLQRTSVLSVIIHILVAVAVAVEVKYQVSVCYYRQ